MCEVWQIDLECENCTFIFMYCIFLLHFNATAYSSEMSSSSQKGNWICSNWWIYLVINILWKKKKKDVSRWLSAVRELFTYWNNALTGEDTVVMCGIYMYTKMRLTVECCIMYFSCVSQCDWMCKFGWYVYVFWYRKDQVLCAWISDKTYLTIICLRIMS